MQKKALFAPPALLAGGATLNTFFENGSSFVQQTQPSGIFQFFRQKAPARTKGEAGVFVGLVAVRRYKATHKNKVLYSDFSEVPQATLNSQFLISRFAVGA